MGARSTIALRAHRRGRAIVGHGFRASQRPIRAVPRHLVAASVAGADRRPQGQSRAVESAKDVDGFHPLQCRCGSAIGLSAGCFQWHAAAACVDDAKGPVRALRSPARCGGGGGGRTSVGGRPLGQLDDRRGMRTVDGFAPQFEYARPARALAAARMCCSPRSGVPNFDQGAKLDQAGGGPSSDVGITPGSPTGADQEGPEAFGDVRLRRPAREKTKGRGRHHAGLPAAWPR